jgi:hypothetical protein
MSLSDACSDFLGATTKAAEELAEFVHYYSAPDYPIAYWSEIDALRRACLAVKQSPPYDPEAFAELFRLAASVMMFHGAPPDTEHSLHREAEMKKLVKLLEEPLDEEEKAAVPAVVQNVMVETKFTPLAAERLKAMLSRVGKSTYDIAIKIISDIGSATVKKMLGL